MAKELLRPLHTRSRFDRNFSHTTQRFGQLADLFSRGFPIISRERRTEMSMGRRLHSDLPGTWRRLAFGFALGACAAFWVGLVAALVVGAPR